MQGSSGGVQVFEACADKQSVPLVTVHVSAGARVARRMLCKNCGAHQTPQWRCGPLGPRTLCNACGVRYKKGLPLTGTARSAELA